jgi:hypothetical protein
MITFEEFMLESKKKYSDSTHPYFKGLSKSTIDSKKRQMKKQAEMDDSDPNAYKKLPGDKSVKNKRSSKHTDAYKRMYGE